MLHHRQQGPPRHPDADVCEHETLVEQIGFDGLPLLPWEREQAS
jgi:hypothetical protein